MWTSQKWAKPTCVKEQIYSEIVFFFFLCSKWWLRNHKSFISLGFYLHRFITACWTKYVFIICSPLFPSALTSLWKQGQLMACKYCIYFHYWTENLTLTFFLFCVRHLKQFFCVCATFQPMWSTLIHSSAAWFSLYNFCFELSKRVSNKSSGRDSNLAPYFVAQWLCCCCCQYLNVIIVFSFIQFVCCQI